MYINVHWIQILLLLFLKLEFSWQSAQYSSCSRLPYSKPFMCLHHFPKFSTETRYSPRYRPSKLRGSCCSLALKREVT